MKTQCNGLWGWLFGHHFEAQYNSAPSQDIKTIRGNSYELFSCIEALTAKTYAGSVCRRCGKIVLAPANTPLRSE